MPEVRRFSCPLNCFDSCSLLISDGGDGQPRVRGDPEHPVTRGFACPKARFLVRALVSSERALRPMVRTDGRLAPVSWQAALDLVADRLTKALADYGPASIVYYHDSGGTGILKGLGRVFFAQLGGVTEASGSLCWSAGLEAQRLDFGAVRAHDPTDILNSRLIVIWGRNPWATNIHLVPLLLEARRRGAKLVVVDPLPSETARHADWHIAPRPGSDAWLALAVSAEIIRQGRHASRFVSESTTGFDDYARAAYGLERRSVEEATGVSHDEWTRLAEAYATSVPAAIIAGYGLQRHAAGGLAVRAIDALAAVAGYLGVPGGGVSYANTAAGQGMASPAAGLLPRRTFPRPLFASGLGALAEPCAQVLVVERANPVSRLPDAGTAAQALAAVPFKVVIDPRLTETASLADVFLPSSCGPEEEDLFAGYWHRYAMWSLPALHKPDSVRAEAEIWAELARRMGIGGWTGTAPRDRILDCLEGLRAHGIGEGARGFWFANPLAEAVPYRDGLFPTADGLFHFAGAAEMSAARAAAPPAHAAEGGLRDGGDRGQSCDPCGKGTYPLVLITPQHRLSLHSQFADVAREVEGWAEDAAICKMARAAAAAAGIADGDRCRLVTPHGAIPVSVRLEGPPWRDDTIMIYAIDGGGPGKVRGPLVNSVISARLTDIGEGAAYYACPARVEPVQAGAAAGDAPIRWFLQDMRQEPMNHKSL